MSRRETFLTLLFAIMTTIAVPGIGLQPRAGGDVLVFVSPWSANERVFEVIARSGGEFVAGTNLEWAAVARSDEGQFVSKLYLNGALLIADSSMAALCAAPGAVAGQQSGKSGL